MSTPMIICHGGAGHGAKDQPGVDEAADAGWRVLNSGGSALEAVMVAVELMENNPRLNAGTGGRHRSDGSVQLDAAVATSDGRLGLVMAIEDTPNPVKVAADILDEEFHILAGRGARVYADNKGHLKASVQGSSRPSDSDTVGAVARDEKGGIAVASSTGGCSGRPPGRVGDTPMWGSGLWCNEDIAVAATGIGEEIMLQMLCHRVALENQESGELLNSLQWGLELFDEDIEVGMIAITMDSGAGLANTKMPWALREGVGTTSELHDV